MLKTQSITHRYGHEGNPVTVLNDVSIEIPENSFTAVVGRSGSGKSTLLSVLSSLLKPDEGQIFFKDDDITEFSSSKLNRLRGKEFSIIFQSHHLLPYLTAHENVLLPFLNQIQPVNKELMKKGLTCLERVGIGNLADRLPGQLSGGEQQRVAIARALVKSPSVLFADEPCGSLDKTTGNEVMRILQSLNEDGLTIVMVTHDPMHAEIASRAIRLEDGRTV